MDRRLFEFDGHVKYPSIVAVKEALKGLIREAEEAGDTALAELRKERYKDLTYEDIEIENLHQFSNGRILVCIIVRERGWMRYDLEIGVADMFDIIEEYQIPYLVAKTFDEMRALVADKTDIEPRLVYQEWRKTFGCIVDSENKCEVIPELLGNVRFSKIERRFTEYDPVALNSGTVYVEDLSVGSEEIFVYVRDDYEPEPPDPDDMTVTRVPMVKGITTLNFKLNKPYTNPVWNLTITAPDLVVGPTVVAEDGQSANVELSLTPGRDYRPAKIKIDIVADVNGDVWTFNKEFEHTPVSFSGFSGSNNLQNVCTSRLDLWGSNKATGLKAYGPLKVRYTSNDDPAVVINYEADILSFSTSGSSLYVRHNCPVFERPGQLRYPLLVDGPEPDSSNWTEAFTGVTMHPPVGATRIIAEPISIVKGETEYDFIGTVKVYWDDEAKTPVDNSTYESHKLTLDPKHNPRSGIKANPTGYDLHFSVLEEAPIDEMTILSKITSYSYTGYPSTWFEHRYNYKGTGGPELVWDRMQYSKQTGVIKIIDPNGVTMDKTLTKVGFQEGIWSTMSEPKRVSGGVGFQVTLDMHIVQYNRPRKELTVVSVSDGDKQYDLETVFDYIPVDIGTLTYVYDPINLVNRFTVKLPEGGIKAEDLIVERDYSYGDNATLTTGWLRDQTVVDEGTVTFTATANRGDDYTYYRFWFANAKELTSSYYVSGEFPHNQ